MLNDLIRGSDWLFGLRISGLCCRVLEFTRFRGELAFRGSHAACPLRWRLEDILFRALLLAPHLDIFVNYFTSKQGRSRTLGLPLRPLTSSRLECS